MSRIILTAILLLALLFQFPQIAHAAIISPDPIGTLTVGQTQKETVSGLQPGKSYFWSQSGPPGYTLFNQCSNADGSGNLDLFLGPYPIVGKYNLSVRLASDVLGVCQSDASAPIDIIRSFTVNPTTTVCTIRTDPATLTGKLPSATFFMNVGDPTVFPAWKMRYDCTGDSGPATRVSGPDTTEIYRVITNPVGTGCSFDIAGNTITAIAVTAQGEGDYCKAQSNPAPTPIPYGTPATAGGDQCSVDDSPGFKTAIGCIPTNPAEFVQAVLKFVLAISGGLAFLLMLLGAFQMLTSAGNPETLQAGRDRFTQAIIGLLFIIFSVLLLQIIGVDILRLRELGG